jgi:hypothetical protein
MNDNPSGNSVKHARTRNKTTANAYRANRLYGPAAEKKARLAIEWGWLHTVEGSVYRHTSGGRDLKLTQFEMNNRPHIRTYFIEHELTLPVERVIELESEVLKGLSVAKDKESNSERSNDANQSKIVDASQDDLHRYDTPWGEMDWQ